MLCIPPKCFSVKSKLSTVDFMKPGWGSSKVVLLYLGNPFTVLLEMCSDPVYGGFVLHSATAYKAQLTFPTA